MESIPLRLWDQNPFMCKLLGSASCQKLPKVSSGESLISWSHGVCAFSSRPAKACLSEFLPCHHPKQHFCIESTHVNSSTPVSPHQNCNLNYFCIFLFTTMPTSMFHRIIGNCTKIKGQWFGESFKPGIRPHFSKVLMLWHTTFLFDLIFIWFFLHFPHFPSNK